MVTTKKNVPISLTLVPTRPVCPDCGKKIRGKNHEDGAHHKKQSLVHRRR